MIGARSVANYSREQARWSNYLNKQDWFFPLRTWPDFLQDLALKCHKNNRERFTLFFFLVGNGLEPQLAGRWCIANDYTIDSGPISKGYDASAYKQVEQMKAQTLLLPGAPGAMFQGNKKIMDMATGRVIKM